METSVRFCPQCGSAGVDYSSLAGGAAHCRGCQWDGPKEELLAVPMADDSDQQLISRLMGEMRKLLSGELGLPYLKFLLRWGFLKADVANIDKTLDRKAYSRYIAAIARAILTAIIEERARSAAADAATAHMTTEASN